MRRALGEAAYEVGINRTGPGLNRASLDDGRSGGGLQGAIAPLGCSLSRAAGLALGRPEAALAADGGRIRRPPAYLW
jgi:hypothetical protein